MLFPEHYILVPATEVENRIGRIIHLLEDRAGLFCWPADLIYLTGSNQIGYLVLKNGFDPLYLVRRSPQRARAESPLPVTPLGSFRDLGRLIKRHFGGNPKRLGLTLDTLPALTALELEHALGRPQVTNLTPALLKIRSQKSNWELDCMARAGEIGRRVFAGLKGLFRPGMSELALSGALLALASQLGSQVLSRSRSFNGEMYPWHVVSGQNGLRTSRVEAPFGGLGLSSSFPQGPSLDPIRPGEPIVVDFGTCYLGYHMDVTRMFSWGEPQPQVIRGLDALKTIEAELLDRLRPGADGRSLYRLALETAADLGYERNFMGLEESKVNFVGHGVGLEISEPPYLAAGRDDELRENQTLALELKLVLPGIGAVGHENTVEVTSQGGRKFSPADEGLTIIG